MDFDVCVQCGKEFEGKGIQFRGRSFCGDECCEKFEDEFIKADEPGIAELDDPEMEVEALAEDEIDDEGLGYDNDPTAEKTRDPLGDDDEYEIDPDDF